MREHSTWCSFATHLRCTACDGELPLERSQNLCACGSPLATMYDLKAARSALRREDLAGRPADLWRYRELLPVKDPAYCVTLGEGMTPLLPLPRLGAKTGFDRLLIKDESQNPTASFKARGLALAVSRAAELGLAHLALPSAGNAGGALAAYAARAGLRAFVSIPNDTPRSFVEECQVLGAEVELVPGLIDVCGQRVAARCKEQGLFDVSTLKEPYRVEGKKTLGYELAEQLGWKLPDVVFYPTGGGTGLVGMWKAFDELGELGWIGPERPRMVCVQSSGCAPIVRAFHAGAPKAEAWQDPETFALGLRVPQARGDAWMLRTLRASDGTAVAVPDAEIAVAGRELALEEGVFPCPEGAATWAAARRMRGTGELQGHETVVLFNTAGWYKYGDAWQRVLGL